MSKKKDTTMSNKGKGALIAFGTCAAIVVAAGAVSEQSEPNAIESESAVTTAAVTKFTEATEPFDINEWLHSEDVEASEETEPAETAAVTEATAASEETVTEKTTEKAEKKTSKTEKESPPATEKTKSTKAETKKPATEKITEATVGGESGQIMVWIPTNGGTKYHSNSSCSSMEDPMYVTLDEAKSLGFTACKRCYG